MARSIRILYRDVPDGFRPNFNWDAIHLDTPVIITAVEFKPQVGGVPGSKTAGRPWRGDANNVYVSNVGPHNPEGETGGVEFCLHTNWGNPINVIVTITALDDIEDFIQ